MTTSTQDATKRSPRDTPAMKQYFGFKKKYPDCVLFFRMGDFYELFDDDAVLASRALGLTLTQRSAGLPMAGVPHHTMDTYALRMLKPAERWVSVSPRFALYFRPRCSSGQPRRGR